MQKGQYLKTILAHNIIVMDLLFVAVLVLLWRQGNNPNTLIKWAVTFYGGEGILSAGIKIVKVNKEKKSDKSEESEEKE